jgi:hypothetical protein
LPGTLGGGQFLEGGKYRGAFLLRRVQGVTGGVALCTTNDPPTASLTVSPARVSSLSGLRRPCHDFALTLAGVLIALVVFKVLLVDDMSSSLGKLVGDKAGPVKGFCWNGTN